MTGTAVSRVVSQAVLAVALLVAATTAWSAELYGQVVRIIDGDTLDVLVQKRPVRVRLAGIDAPERRQPFGEKARQHLADLAFQKTVRVIEHDTDHYGRTLGIVLAATSDGTTPSLNLNAAMVRAGMAWAYRHNGRPADPAMERLERSARQERIGLWSDPKAVEPWMWRRASRGIGS
nr:thermonuclease family protein [Cupriavidus gilardii]